GFAVEPLRAVHARVAAFHSPPFLGRPDCADAAAEVPARELVVGSRIAAARTLSPRERAGAHLQARQDGNEEVRTSVAESAPQRGLLAPLRSRRIEAPGREPDAGGAASLRPTDVRVHVAALIGCCLQSLQGRSGVPHLAWRAEIGAEPR